MLATFLGAICVAGITAHPIADASGLSEKRKMLAREEASYDQDAGGRRRLHVASMPHHREPASESFDNRSSTLAGLAPQASNFDLSTAIKPSIAPCSSADVVGEIISA